MESIFFERLEPRRSTQTLMPIGNMTMESILGSCPMIDPVNMFNPGIQYTQNQYQPVQTFSGQGFTAMNTGTFNMGSYGQMPYSMGTGLGSSLNMGGILGGCPAVEPIPGQSVIGSFFGGGCAVIDPAMSNTVMGTMFGGCNVEPYSMQQMAGSIGAQSSYMGSYSGQSFAPMLGNFGSMGSINTGGLFGGCPVIDPAINVGGVFGCPAIDPAPFGSIFGTMNTQTINSGLFGTGAYNVGTYSPVTTFNPGGGFSLGSQIGQIGTILGGGCGAIDPVPFESIAGSLINNPYLNSGFYQY